MWRKLGSKLILDHPRLKVFEDKVLLPNGQKINYLHFGKRPDSAMVICQRQDKKILVQFEYSYPPDQWLAQFPGGGGQEKETPLITANRELTEEAGFIAKNLLPLGKYLINNRRSNAYMWVFWGRKLKKVPRKNDQEENFKYRWYSQEEIDKMIRDGKIKNNHFLAAWSLFQAKTKVCG